MTGEALYGPLEGARLPGWPIDLTTVEAAMKRDPSLELSLSRPSLFGRAMGWFMVKRQIAGRGFMPWYFHATMQRKDRRRRRMDQGLGVVVEGRARYYPRAAIGAGILDDWSGRELRVFTRDLDRIPTAEWSDGTRPFQLFTRWYGFSFTHPGCEIFGEDEPALSSGGVLAD